MQTQDWTVHAPYEDTPEISAAIRKTSKISLRIGRLHLLVAYFGGSGLEPVGWRGVHHPLFPSRCRLWIDTGFQNRSRNTTTGIEHGVVSCRAGCCEALLAGTTRAKGATRA